MSSCLAVIEEKEREWMALLSTGCRWPALHKVFFFFFFEGCALKCMNYLRSASCLGQATSLTPGSSAGLHRGSTFPGGPALPARPDRPRPAPRGQAAGWGEPLREAGTLLQHIFCLSADTIPQGISRDHFWKMKKKATPNNAERTQWVLSHESWESEHKQVATTPTDVGGFEVQWLTWRFGVRHSDSPLTGPVPSDP